MSHERRIRTGVWVLLTVLGLAAGCTAPEKAPAIVAAKAPERPKPYAVQKTEEAWKEQLSPLQYNVLRQKGTEMAFTGRYWKSKDTGTYHCAACGHPLFTSDTKYDSGTGWPSFWQPLSPGAVETHEDRELGMTRTEVVCAHCGSHLGHVFDDGPEPTGLRYCMNSVSLDFKPK